MSESESSDPSTTSQSNSYYYSDDAGPAVVSPRKLENKKPVNKHSHPVIACIFIEVLIPILFLVIALTTQSVLGLIQILFIIIHTILTNKMKTKTSAIKVFLVFEIILNLVIFVLAIIANSDEATRESEAAKLVGFEFNNQVVHDPISTIVLSIIAVLVKVVALILLIKTPACDLIAVRKKFFSSAAWKYVADIIWCFCLGYVSASQNSYLNYPLLIYFAYISITNGLFGKPFVSDSILGIVYIYTIIYSLFVYYQTSYIGHEYSLSTYVQYRKISPDSIDGLLMAILMLQIFLSVQQCFLSGGFSKVPDIFHYASDYVIYLCFAATFIFSLFYPCFCSVAWLAITNIALFFPIRIIKSFFFRLLTTIYNITFVAIVITSFDTFIIKDTNIKAAQWVQKAGLFKFVGDFTFTVIGFIIASLLAQLGRIVHSPPPKEHEEEVEVDNTPEKIVLDEDGKKVEEPPTTKERAKAFWKSTLNVLKIAGLFIINYGSIAVQICLNLTTAFKPNRLCFHVIFFIMLAVVLLGLYKIWVFQVIKALTALIMITAIFFNVYEVDGELSILKEIGIATPDDSTLLDYIWPLAVTFVLACITTIGNTKIDVTFPPIVVALLIWLIAIFHLIYVFIAPTNIFTIIYLLIAILIFLFQVIGKNRGVAVMTIFSGIGISAQLCIFMFSEYEELRNFITGLIPKNIIDISTPVEMNAEVIILAVQLFISSLTFNNNTKLRPKTHFIAQGIMEELKAICRSFFFYISWVLMFLFSIANDYPTIIKFVLQLIYLLGSKIARFYNMLTTPLLVFQIIFLLVEVGVDVFSSYIISNQTLVEWLSYVGLYFEKGGKQTIYGRNMSMLWQLIYIFISIINIISAKPEPSDPRFLDSIPMRLYTAFYTMLHHLLPVIVNVMLCISTLFNPSIFGWMSFIVLMIVQFKPDTLRKSALWLTALFNLSFIVQYIMWLGMPDGKSFNLGPLSAGKDYEDWGEFLGITNVTTDALVSNCLSALIFTFYLQFRDLFVDYDSAFDNLPETIKALVHFLMSYIFEIAATINIVISVPIPTFDAFFFFLLIGSLFFSTLFFGYDLYKTNSIQMWGTFFVIGGRLLSRTPIFLDKGVGEIVKEAFDLPFKGESTSEQLWIVIFTLQSLAMHLMHSEMYTKCFKNRNQRLAYRFVRVRQLKALEQINQEILYLLHEQRMDPLRKIEDARVEAVPTMDRLLARQESNVISSISVARFGSMTNLPDVEAGENESDNEEEEEIEKPSKIALFFEKIPHWIVEHIVHPLMRIFVVITAQTASINAEQGINVLTIQSVIGILRRELSTLRGGQQFILQPNDRQYLRSLPPSFKYQFNSIADLLNFDEIKEEELFEYTIRAIGIWLRRSAFPILILITLIYAFIKSYLFSLIILFYVISLFIASDIYGQPNLYRVFFAILLVMLGLRHISTVNILKDYLTTAATSVATSQMGVNVFSLLGINPTESSAIEICVFLAGTWFIVDHLAYATVFPPAIMVQRFEGVKGLEKFPEKFYYHFDNPERNLNLGLKRTPSIIQQIKAPMQQMGLFDSKHAIWHLAVEFVGLIIMLIFYGTWTNSEVTADISSEVSFTMTINAGYVFVIIIYCAIILITYFMYVSSNYMGLNIVNLVCLIATVVIVFFVVPSINPNSQSSLQFFFFIRFCATMIAAHKCRTGTIFSDFNYPNFAKNNTYISWTNKFIMNVPFVFEIYSIIQWMAKRTRVHLSEYFIITDIKLKLETLICEQVAEDPDEHEKEQSRFCIGGWLLVALLAILFVPLFFMTDSAGATLTNPPLTTELEIGIRNCGAIYKAFGTVNPITSRQHQNLADSPYKYINQFGKAKQQDIFILNFPTVSTESMTAVNECIIINCQNDDAPVTPYYRIRTTFMYSTSPSNIQDVVVEGLFDPLTDEISLELKELVQDIRQEYITGFIELPSAILVPTQNPIKSRFTPSVIADFTISGSMGKFMFPAESHTAVVGEGYDVVVWSQPVDSGLIGYILSSSGGIVGIYILIIFTFGEVLRERTTNQFDTLWLDRMQAPMKLYRMVVAFEALRMADEVKLEQDMAMSLLEVLKSQQKCIEMTENESVDN